MDYEAVSRYNLNVTIETDNLSEAMVIFHNVGVEIYSMVPS
jgi:hypothetical protein